MIIPPLHIVLFMTRGMSLLTWEKNGSLERELALYTEFAQYGCKTTIISWGDNQDKAIAARYPWLKVCVNAWNLSQERYEQLIPLLYAIDFIQADIIKSNQTNGADCAWRCARLWQKPFIARCGYIWSEFCNNMNSQDFQRAQYIEKEVYKNCDIGIVTTEESRQFLEQEYIIAKGKIKVLPNYVPTSYYQYPILHQSYQQKHSIITQVGRLAEQKNIFSLIDACSKLSVTLRLIGDGPLKEQLQLYAKQHNVNAEFMGSVNTNELPHLLGESTIVTLVSHYEGHPKTLIEAMARGCAVLGTKVRGIASIIKDGRNGLLCNTDPESIRIGLETLLSDQNLRERLGQQARRDALQFSVTQIAECELKLYTTLPKISSLKKIKNALIIFYSLLPKIANKLHKNISHTIDKYIYSTFINLINIYIKPKRPTDKLRSIFTFENRLQLLVKELIDTYDNMYTKEIYYNFFVERLQQNERVLYICYDNRSFSHQIASDTGANITTININTTKSSSHHQNIAHIDIKLFQENIDKILPEGYFDTIILPDTLAYISNRVEFLRIVQKYLHPHRFLIHVPIFERDWHVLLKQKLGIEWHSDLTPPIEYTQEQLSCELTCAGLSFTELQIRWGDIWCEAYTDISYAQEKPLHPKVTVLMAVHNGEKYLEDAVKSILRQTLRNFIFLIIDDASTDSSATILSNLARKDARIRILTNSKNLGLAASLNRGIAQVETPYIARMDADDIALPLRLERQLAYMEQNPDICASGTWALHFMDDKYIQTYKTPCNINILRNRTLKFSPQIIHPTAFIRTASLKAIQGYDEHFSCAQDYDLWLRLLKQGILSNIPHPLLLYRIHDTNISKIKAEQQVINHFLALRKSEIQEFNAEHFNISSYSWDTVLSLLDVSCQSFYTLLTLIIHRKINKKRDIIIKILKKLKEDILIAEKTRLSLPNSDTQLLCTLINIDVPQDVDWNIFLHILKSTPDIFYSNL